MIRTFSRPLWLLLVVLPGLATAQDRLALVVGIDRYEQVADLQKATNDARAISDALATVGFDVTALTDVDERSFNRGLDRFISDVKPGDEVVFFFAGHGVEIDGRNYLLPSDAPNGASERTIRAESILADQVLSDIQSAGASVAVMILDACRDNPYAGGGRSVGGARGLSIVSAPEGSFVLLSAASGEVAFEGDDSDPNSIFTRALLPLLQEPGLPLPNLARRLRNDVQRLASASGRSQRPAYYDEVSGEFMFVPGASSQPAGPAGDPCARARADWGIVGETDSPAVLEAFRVAHADCPLMVAMATHRLTSMQEQPKRAPSPVVDQGYNAESTAAYEACARLADPEIVPFPDLVSSDLVAAERACRTALASGLDESSERYFSAAAFLGRTLSAQDKLSEAARYTRIAAEGGNWVGMNNLGVMYEHGRGVQQSETEAVRWYRAGAESGYSFAMNNLGLMYLDGRGVPQSDREAVRWYRAGAEAGNPWAMGNLGWMYERGRGVPQNDGEAVRWYRAGADAGDAGAMNNLGLMYERGRGVSQSDTEAVRWYRAAAEAGNAQAMGNLGWMHQNGRGVAKSDSEAVRWYRAGADAGNPRAMGNLGWMYENGRGVTQSDSEAVRWYRTGAEAGHADSMGNLAWMYENGRGVSRSESEAARWYRAGAEAGNSRSMRSLGWLYQNGRGVAQDDAEALRWYRAGAEAGSMIAMNDVGWMYQNGRGVAPDDREAARWYRSSAEAGYALAMNNLGWMYENGRGLTQSDSEAARWYLAGAEAGDPGAMNNLGLAYQDGRGVSQNDREAVRWYQAAAAAGNASAMTNLGWMYESARGVTQSFSSAANQYLSAIKGGNDWSLTNASSLKSGTVREIQHILKSEGLYDGAVDGVAGPGTVAAMRGYATQ